ncbi:MAG: helix-hairpin-helix domain-containing protein [Polyangiales bacterium]
MANVPGKTDSSIGPAQRIQAGGPQDTRVSSSAIDLNGASEQDIAEIDMIGKKLAHAIVAARGQRGGFSSWEELREVPGLDAMKIAELQRAARLGPPS